MPLIQTNEIAGIALHYARERNHPYGTRGRPVSFSLNDNFARKLNACFTELFAACPLGRPEVITSAGAFVDKPGTHGSGAAFDLDALFWDDYTLLTTSFPTDYELYLGIESYLRRHFGIVLNYLYDAPHRDHWHVDDSVSTDFNAGSRSKVLYLQATLTYLYRRQVILDGLWGPQTETAFTTVLGELKIENGRDGAGWMTYLEKTGRIAFELFSPVKAPARLLEGVYALLGEHPAALRRGVTEALNAFRLHPATTEWLGRTDAATTTLAAAIEKVNG